MHVTIGGVIRAELGVGILGTGLWIYCLLDVIMADEGRIRNLGKSTWIWVVLVTSVVGAVAWLVAGKPESTSRGLPYKGNTGRTGYTEYDRPGRFVPTDPQADEAFLRQVRERAEAQRQEAKLQRLAREQREERERQEIREAHERRRLRPTEPNPYTQPEQPDQPTQAGATDQPS